MDWVVEARTLAYEAHAGQQDKAGRPYIEHVARVAAAIHDDDTAKAAAWLHDVVEDCPEHAARLEAFPAPVREIVTLLSRHSAPDATQYYASIRQHPRALKVKLADIADNAHPRRLLQLPPAVAERLRGKYAAALAALGTGNAPIVVPDPAPARVLQLMETARMRVRQAEDAGAGAHTGDDTPGPHLKALISARDTALAELEAQLTAEAFILWSDMHVLA
ncbi:guanosine-3',5'-bis(diphosphate) 3'-pyrophosphohydrolase [Stenotrophomonas sp. SAU14A_NAIMI4_5]|uniref:HD domain-containing protein n=1 Tax=Stenotrophomonas sp. SAU14A_NAIMI4_5 TaxID=2072413 RepID=UPI000D54171B|nr:HD domain-containing protein [Stenotrophomonas sp. SAU14A_NAIMI4_5]AWH51596.1 guanosine-3',5'-bis(diphosphate) 3'-pyrophosphohydrolase [Stenotrophomonas sp. SAU14A_NAIMI4_5]